MKNISKLFYGGLLAIALGVILFAAFGTTTAFVIGSVGSMLATQLMSFAPMVEGLSFTSFVWLDTKGQFKALSAGEMKSLKEDEQLQYAEAREAHSMKSLNDLHENYLLAKEKGEDLEMIVKSIKETQEEQSIAQKELMNIVLEVVKNGKKNSATPVKSDFEALRDGLKDNLPALKESLAGKVQGFIAVKAPGTITRPTNITGAEADRLPQPEYVQGLNLIPEKNPFITTLLDSGTTGSATIVYIEEKNPEGDFEMTAEGALKPLLDFEISPGKSDAKVCAGVIKVSNQMLSDIDFMASEINSRLRKKHDLKLEDNILNGDGLGENFNGITNQAPAFTAGSLALSVVSPNNSDVIRAAINQILVSSDGAFYPTSVLVHPDDAAAMDLQKDSQGAYVLPPFQSADGRVIAGVQVMQKTKIPTGYFLVADFGQAKFRNYEGFSIAMGWENDDFRRNLITVLGESRNHFYIMSNDLSAFVYDQFSVAKTALLKP